MPKKQILEGIIIIILLGFVCKYIYDNYKVESKTSLIVDSGDSEEIVEYFKDKKGNSFYLYGIDDVIVDYTDRTLELDRALEAKQITISEVLTFLKKQYTLENDKVVMYQNDDLAILQCKLDNNKTNYILAKPGIVYEEGLCNQTPYLCTFTKTYYVLSINEGKYNEKLYVTLRNDASEDVDTIEMDREIASDLIKDNYYVFKFASIDKEIEENIKDIFNNNQILNISVADASNQVNENICK